MTWIELKAKLMEAAYKDTTYPEKKRKGYPFTNSKRGKLNTMYAEISSYPSLRGLMGSRRPQYNLDAVVELCRSLGLKIHHDGIIPPAFGGHFDRRKVRIVIDGVSDFVPAFVTEKQLAFDKEVWKKFMEIDGKPWLYDRRWHDNYKGVQRYRYLGIEKTDVEFKRPNLGVMLDWIQDPESGWEGKVSWEYTKFRYRRFDLASNRFVKHAYSCILFTVKQ